MTPPSLSSHDGDRLPHLPGLDGLRGVAVVAVLLFHSEFEWARGGHLGVTTFFVLSGFLITSLLLVEHERTGRVSLADFWGRRARRLVPAAMLAVALGGLYLGYGAARVTKDAFLDGVASLFWIANWRFIANGQSYDDLFAEPSPFRHFWSLAIEEQFYVALPLLVVGVLTFTASRRAAVWTLGAVLAVVVVASTEWVALLHSPGDAPLRAYYGTDARVAEPALGALLAVLLVDGGRLRSFGHRARQALDAVAVIAASVLTFLMSGLSVYSAWLYDGGLLLAGSLAAIVIAAATQGGAVSRLLGGSVLCALGRISYGVYLFHWPIFLWLDREATGMSGGALLLLRTTATLTLAAVSYAVIEQPVRLGRLLPRVAGVAWANAAIAVVAALAALTGTVSWPAPSPAATEVASGSRPRFTANAPSVTPARAAPTAGAGEAAPSATAANGGPSAPAHSAAPVVEPSPTPSPGSSHSPPPAPATRYRVAFIGDSVAQNLSHGMMRWGRAEGFDVLDLTMPACPMSRGGERRFAEGRPFPIAPECDWWDDPTSGKWEELRSFNPDVIVVHDGLNELPDRKLDEWPKWMRPGEPIFDTWLTGEYRALIDAVADQDISLLLLNVPCADWDRSEEFAAMQDPDGRVRALNTVVYHELGTSATRVVDLFRYLCPGGRYTDTVDGVPGARPDGFHLSDPAANRAAERLLAPPIRELADQRRSAVGR